MKLKQMLAACIAGGMLLLQVGCLAVAAVGAGAGAVMYIRGDLVTTSAKPVEEVYAAVEQTCQELEFEITEQEKKAFSGTIVANSDFGRVIFEMKGESPTKTKISIRVGAFGDKGASELILEKLKPKI